MKLIHTSGKRKKAVARATLTQGTGQVLINNQLLDTVSPGLAQMKIKEPIILAGKFANEVNIAVIVMGGGMMGRADAARLAIARALALHASELKNKFLSYDRTLLVADVRMRETRKPNAHGNARAKVQKSYR